MRRRTRRNPFVLFDDFDTDTRLDDTRTPTDGSVTLAKLEATFAAALATLTGTQNLSNKTLVSPKMADVLDSNGVTILELAATASAVNHLRVENAAAGQPVQLRGFGSDSNIGFWLRPKGNAAVSIYAGTGITPQLAAAGADPNVSLNLVGKGTGGVQANGSTILTSVTMHAATGKTTPVDADEFALVDSAASNGLKKLSWGDLKTTMAAYIVGGAPAALDTLNELAAALGNDASFATTVTNGLALKAPLSGATLTGATLTSPKIGTSILDTNGATLLGLPSPVASAVNYAQLENAATGGAVQVRALGSDSNVALMLRPKGNQSTQIYAATGQTPTLEAVGADSAHNLNLKSKGTGVVQINGNPAGVKVSVPGSASATGVQGQWAADSSYHYDCIATNTWVRSAAATW